ncbi:MAG: NUDIX hydrolase [Candidatus Nanopelagicales bacterium]
MSRGSHEVIRAAGVVLLRSRGGKVQVGVVHRPRHKDWSHPKGKVERGESVVVAAARETLEETGERAVLGTPLITERYTVEGRPKTVRYWAGWLASGGPGFKPNHEIDQVEWLSPDKAAKKLTYPRDVQLMRAAVSAPRTVPLIILRHAQAVKRTDWHKSDPARPLAADGKRQAKDLIPALQAFGITRLYSSDATRCVDTLTPFADRRRLSIRLERLFSEEGYDGKKRGSLRLLNNLVDNPAATVLCTHRPVLPELLDHVQRQLGLSKREQLDPGLAPGGFIVLHREFHPKKGVRVTAIERHDA